MSHRAITLSAAIPLVALMVGFAGFRVVSNGGALGANDRSRWVHVIALAEDGVHHIGKRTFKSDGSHEDSGLFTRPEWGTVDVVLDPKTHLFYSSKPPILAIAITPLYRALHGPTGVATDESRNRAIVKTLLVFNLTLMLLWALALLGIAREAGASPKGQLVVLWCGGFATFIPTFSGSLTNHLPATVLGAWVVLLLLRLEGAPTTWKRGLAISTGGAMGLMVTLELPAMAIFSAYAFTLLLRKKWLWFALLSSGFALGALPFFLASQAVLGAPFPPWLAGAPEWTHYQGHFSEEGNAGAFRSESPLRHVFHGLFGHHGLFFLTPLFLLPAWYRLPTPAGPSHRLAKLIRLVGPILALVPVLASFRILSRGRSALPLPLLLVLVAYLGLLVLLLPWKWWRHTFNPAALFRRLLVFSGGLSLLFYFYKAGTIGGMAAGPRWFMWLTPLWLVVFSISVDDLVAQKKSRRILVIFGTLSLIWSQTVGANPWVWPTPYAIIRALGL
jgi:hypothetical protein